ncbi:MAG: hypothetical protein IMY72_10755 [Bacteroidetes bacterium]|nr:hypothetical protein [Bacteroidota bacterium]
MIEDHNDLITSLKNKIKKLVIKYEDKKQKYNSLLADNTDLKKDLESQKNEFEQLKIKFKKLELTKAFLSSSEDTHDAKLKINGIVREIDNCIALLNR